MICHALSCKAHAPKAYTMLLPPFTLFMRLYFLPGTSFAPHATGVQVPVLPLPTWHGGDVEARHLGRYLRQRQQDVRQRQQSLRAV